ncbi:neprilysin-1-like [Ornithodoros turicata]|uniref:neprilysin-1-like n=1 Tax=Ornithodoros turicata TaxID=34597 RepID=UPI0031390A0B
MSQVEPTEEQEVDEAPEVTLRKQRLLAVAAFTLGIVAFGASAAVISLSKEDTSEIMADPDENQENLFREPPGQDKIARKTTRHPVSVRPNGHPVSVNPSHHPVPVRPSDHPVSVRPNGNNDGQTCNTADCRSMRWLIDSSVDTTKDPCDNFFAYVCNGANNLFSGNEGDGMLGWVSRNLTTDLDRWLKDTSAPDDHQDGFEKVVRLYKSCVDVSQSRNQAIFNVLTSYNMSLKNGLHFDPLDMQTRFLRNGLPIIFEMYPYPSRSRKEVLIRLATSNDEFAMFRNRTLQDAAVREALYVKVVNWVLGPPNIDASATSRILRAEEKVHQIASSNNYPQQDHIFPITDLGHLLGSTAEDTSLSSRWKAVLQKWFESTLLLNPPLLMDVNDLHLFHNLFGTNATLTTDELRTFIAWRTTLHFYNEAGMATNVDTDTRCLTNVVHLLPSVAPVRVLLGNIYEPRVDLVRDMAYNILEEIKASLGTTTWLDDTTRRAALDKISNAFQVIGYPFDLYSGGVVDTYMNAVSDMTGDYIINYIKTKTSAVERMFNMTQDADAVDWLIEAQLARRLPLNVAKTVNIRQLNAIFIPPAMMYWPMFTYGGPPEVNYGALGRILSRELMTGLDEQGLRYNSMGDEKPWFTEASKNAYDNLVACHKASVGHSPQANQNAEFSSELLADTMASESLLKAYKKVTSEGSLGEMKGLTSDKLFYVAWCLLFCGQTAPGGHNLPLDKRCNVPLMNSEHFAKTFECRHRAPMNPEQKCKFW